MLLSFHGTIHVVGTLVLDHARIQRQWCACKHKWHPITLDCLWVHVAIRYPRGALLYQELARSRNDRIRRPPLSTHDMPIAHSLSYIVFFVNPTVHLSGVAWIWTRHDGIHFCLVGSSTRCSCGAKYLVRCNQLFLRTGI